VGDTSLLNGSRLLKHPIRTISILCLTEKHIGTIEGSELLYFPAG
jgi:hypothetical protein